MRPEEMKSALEKPTENYLQQDSLVYQLVSNEGQTYDALHDHLVERLDDLWAKRQVLVEAIEDRLENERKCRSERAEFEKNLIPINEEMEDLRLQLHTIKNHQRHAQAEIDG